MFILWQYLTEIIDTKSIPGKIYENFGMVHFAEINHVGEGPYSMLQDIGRVARAKKLPRNCLRYLQTILIMGAEELVSEFMWGITVSVFLLCPFSVKMSIKKSISLWTYFSVSILYARERKPLWYVVLYLSLVLFAHLLLTFSKRFWNRKSYYLCLWYLHQGNWAVCFHFRIHLCIVPMDLDYSGCLKTVMIVFYY